MKFVCNQNFESVSLGSLKKGDIVELTKDNAKQLVDAGLVSLHVEEAVRLREKKLNV